MAKKLREILLETFKGIKSIISQSIKIGKKNCKICLTKNPNNMLSDEIKSFNQELPEFQELFNELKEDAKADPDIAFDFYDIPDRVSCLDKEINELKGELASMSNIELLNEELQNGEEESYNDDLPGAYDLTIASSAALAALL